VITNEAEGLTFEIALKNVLNKRRDAGFSSPIVVIEHKVTVGECGPLLHYVRVESTNAW
jgi:hypothetical protein